MKYENCHMNFTKYFAMIFLKNNFAMIEFCRINYEDNFERLNILKILVI